MNELLIGLMTVSEIASSLGVNERTIRKYIERLFPDRMRNGVVTRLNEEEVTLIKMNLEKNRHLERSGQLPKTQLEKKLLIQQAMGFLSEEIEELKQVVEKQSLQLKEAQPKIEFSDHIEASVNSITVVEFANILAKNGLKIGQNRLFRFLYENKYLIDSSRPYQVSLDRGLFEIREIFYRDHKNNERVANKVLITGKGQITLAKVICNNAGAK